MKDQHRLSHSRLGFVHLDVGLCLALALTLGCSAHPTPKEVAPSFIVPGSPPQVTISEEVMHHFEVMDQADSDQELARSLDALRARPGIVAEIERLYMDLTQADVAEDEDRALLGYARWKAVNLLGSLGDAAAVEPLARIAAAALPDPLRVSEVRYATEYRIRLRAIAGLETLRAVEPLERLYGQAGLLRGAVAASLWELDRAPQGVVAVDKTAELTVPPPRYRKLKVPAGAERLPGTDEGGYESPAGAAIVPDDGKEGPR